MMVCLSNSLGMFNWLNLLLPVHFSLDVIFKSIQHVLKVDVAKGITNNLSSEDNIGYVKLDFGLELFKD